MDWLTDRFSERVGSESGPLQIMYRIDGSSDLVEEVLDEPRGLPRLVAGPDRERRRRPAPAGHLRRADRLGLPLQQARRRRSRTRAWADLSRIVEWVCENWDQADEGIWEARGGRQHFTYSRLMCWVAVERAVRIARQRGLPADLVRWMADPRRDLRPGDGQGLARRSAAPSSSTTTPTCSTRPCC